MNKWVEKSIEIANSPSYLDKLHEVYPVTHANERGLSEEKLSALRTLYEGNESIELLRFLLNLPKFPLNDPYVAFLRKKKESIEENPETVKRIVRSIREMGFDNMVKALVEPKQFNRQMGSLFRKWMDSLNYPHVSPEELQKHPIAILKIGDKGLLEFVKAKFGLALDKAPDFLIKAGEKYVIGEAKFLTDYGGHQYAQLQDALRLLNQNRGDRVVPVAILDGVVWIKNSSKMYRSITKIENPAFTALLLIEFISCLSNSYH